MLNVFKCPYCQKRIETNLEIGQKIACPYCDEEFKLHRSHEASRNDVGNSIAKILIPLGYVLFVGVPLTLTIGFFVLRAQQQEEPPAKPAPVADATPVAKKPDLQPARKPRKPRKSGGDTEEEDPATTPKTQEPLKLKPSKPEIPGSTSGSEVAIAPEPREVPQIPVAPAPHEVAWEIPLRDFHSKWQTVGAVDVRIAGLAVAKVPLLNGKGEVQDSAAAMLVVAVEVRLNTANKTRTLQTWIRDKVYHARIYLANGKELGSGSLPVGAKFHLGLALQQPIPPDQTPVRDILVFAAPADDAGELSLRLDAERCGESGDIWIKIPDSAWKK